MVKSTGYEQKTLVVSVGNLDHLPAVLPKPTSTEAGLLPWMNSFLTLFTINYSITF